MKKIEVANFSQSMPHLAATVLFDENSQKPRIIGRSGYIKDAVWDELAISAAKKLRPEH